MLTLDDLEDAARLVAAHLPVTPAYRWPLLERVTGGPTWVKHELQTGAVVPGLIAATRGNHGQSVAYAGQRRGLPVTIVVPEGNSPDKNASMAAFGADLVVHGRDFQESLEHARALAEERGLVFVPSFHPDLVAGVATGAAELHAQAGRLDVIYVPVGLGSGICAHVAVRDLLGVGTEIVGVVADRAPAHALSFAAGRPVSTTDADTFVDGVATRTPVPDAVAAMVAGVSRFVRVPEAEAERAMRVLGQTTHQMPEPAGAIALAGLLNDPGRSPDATAAVIMTGGNCDTDLVLRVLSGGSSVIPA